MHNILSKIDIFVSRYVIGKYSLIIYQISLLVNSAKILLGPQGWVWFSFVSFWQFD